MADYGFGIGEFGRGPFGRADFSKDALWELSVPDRNKDDDELVGGDLEQFLDVVGEFVDDALERAMRFPDQGDPVTALSGAEHEETLTVTSTADVGDGQFRLEIDPADRQIVEKLFPRSLDSNDVPRSDGWVAVIDRDFFRITRVQAHDRDASTDAALTLEEALR